MLFAELRTPGRLERPPAAVVCTESAVSGGTGSPAEARTLPPSRPSGSNICRCSLAMSAKPAPRTYTACTRWSKKDGSNGGTMSCPQSAPRRTELRPWSPAYSARYLAVGGPRTSADGASRKQRAAWLYLLLIARPWWSGSGRHPGRCQNTDCRGHAWSRDREITHVLARSPARPRVDVVRKLSAN
jgi:hypothetical protein